jgi:hypothetical protein
VKSFSNTLPEANQLNRAERRGGRALVRRRSAHAPLEHGSPPGAGEVRDDLARMPFETFVQTFGLPPIVPNKRSCEILACGHSKLYDLREKGKLRIVPRPGGGTGTPAWDLYQLYVAAVS